MATLTFHTVQKKFEGRVSSLYFHNVQNEGAFLKQLMSSGWCVVNTPRLSTNHYLPAINYCRDVLHPSNANGSVEKHPDLLPIGPLAKVKTTPLTIDTIFSCLKKLQNGTREFLTAAAMTMKMVIWYH